MLLAGPQQLPSRGNVPNVGSAGVAAQAQGPSVSSSLLCSWSCVAAQYAVYGMYAIMAHGHEDVHRQAASSARCPQTALAPMTSWTMGHRGVRQKPAHCPHGLLSGILC